MNEDPSQLKHRLRQEMKAALRALAPEDRDAGSRAIHHRLRAQPLWNEAKAVLLFCALPEEPDLSPLLHELLREGRIACLPRYETGTGNYRAARIQSVDHDLRPGRFGVLEPANSCSELDMNRLDLVLAPGLGFSPAGTRLGRGRGFYDRLLSRTNARKCGVAFDCQINPVIPAESHDILMNHIVTPTQWLGPCVA